MTTVAPTRRPVLRAAVVRKLLALGLMLLVLAGWGAWQYLRRQSVDSETLGPLPSDRQAMTVLLVEPDVTLGIDAGLRRDHTASLARALARRLDEAGYRTQSLSARSDEERFGQTAQGQDRDAAAAHQTRIAQAIRDFAAPVLRVSLADQRMDGRRVAEHTYRVELLEPQSLQPAWRATLTWREGRYQSIALLWHLRKNRLPPPQWDSLADLAMQRLRRDGVIGQSAVIR
ncbi:hypothetical protein [Lysobacter antibioticus]|uniref:hypothetical protein n=1 Tax=Lysobacter antibioticus TaxID=84531 RepID=UPI0003499C6B|nr:hypothetical protein [Lysobacter antibioticus]